MASGGQWEVVGAKKPKSSNGSAAAEKKSNKELQNDKESKQPNKPLPKTVRPLHTFKINATTEGDSKKEEYFFQEDTPHTAQSKPQKNVSKKAAPARSRTLKEAIAKLNLSELQSLCKSMRSKFNNDPLIWLKDLASYLNLRLNPSTPVDSAYRQELVNAAPLDYVSLPIREFLVRVVQGCSVDVLAQFHRHCFTCMLHEAMRGLPVHGFAIFVQVLGNVCRDACVVYASDYIALRQMYDTHPRPGLTYVWLLSHTIVTAASAKEYVQAVNMWTQGLLPLVGSKQYSALAVQCGREMLARMEGVCTQAAAVAGEQSDSQDKQAANTHKSPAIVTCSQLVQLLEVSFASSTQIPRNINKQLADIFVKFKVLCCSSSESSAVMTQLLPRLLPSCSPIMAQQIAGACGQCLQSSGSKCWNVWRQLLTKHLLQSARLLKLLAADATLCGVLCSATAERSLQDFNDTVTKMAPDSAPARELSRELQRVQVTVASRASRSGRVTTPTRPSLLRRVVRLLFYVLLTAALLGYCAVLLEDRPHLYGSDTLVGRVAAKAGVSDQTLREAVQTAATRSKRFANSTLVCRQRLMSVVRPYVTVLQSRAGDAAQWVFNQYPGLATAVADTWERCSSAAEAGWTAALAAARKTLGV